MGSTYTPISAEDIKIIFLNFIEKSISIHTFIFSVYLLFVLIFVCHIKFKTLVMLLLGFLFFCISFLLVYDITYINYLMSLHLDTSIRVFLGSRVGHFSLASHAPSKAMPKINANQLNILEIKWQQFFLVKEAFKYVELVQKRKLYLSRIYILILDFPIRKYILKDGVVKEINWNVFIKKIHSFKLQYI